MANTPVTAARPPVPQPRDPEDADRSAGGRKGKKRRIRQPLRHRLKRDKALLLFCLPGVLYFALFFYLPLAGNVIAFQDYQPFLGFKQSPFVGMANFTALLAEPEFWSAVSNTLQITAIQLLLYFPAPIAWRSCSTRSSARRSSGSSRPSSTSRTSCPGSSSSRCSSRYSVAPARSPPCSWSTGSASAT